MIRVIGKGSEGGKNLVDSIDKYLVGWTASVQRRSRVPISAPLSAAALDGVVSKIMLMDMDQKLKPSKYQQNTGEQYDVFSHAVSLPSMEGCSMTCCLWLWRPKVAVASGNQFNS
jgi:hypothetical protein